MLYAHLIMSSVTYASTLTGNLDYAQLYLSYACTCLRIEFRTSFDEYHGDIFMASGCGSVQRRERILQILIHRPLFGKKELDHL